MLLLHHFRGNALPMHFGVSLFFCVAKLLHVDLRVPHAPVHTYHLQYLCAMHWFLMLTVNPINKFKPLPAAPATGENPTFNFVVSIH